MSETLQFLKEVPSLTTVDLIKLTGAGGRNGTPKPAQWKAEGRIFSIEVDGTEYFPSFQLDDNRQPIEELAEVLEQLAEWDDWQIARWFSSPNAVLGDFAPMDMLPRSPREVVRAAKRAAS